MLKRQIIREELSRHKTVTSKIKYIVFAFKFELIVAIVVLGFVVFFAHSILVHDNPVLNVGIYTPNKEINSLQISTTSEKLVKVLHVNYNNHRDTVSITAGSTMKISDKTKMQSMLMAGQLDVLVVGKNDFNTLKKKTKNFKVIPNNLTQKIKSQYKFTHKGRIVGISANQLPIFKNTVKSNNIIFCLPSNGKNSKETNKLINYLSSSIH